MASFVCPTCSTQFAESAQPPASCPICEDPRQYVLPEGQRWTTLDEMRASHALSLEPQGELTAIRATPKVGIGQRPLLVPFGDTYLMWDCIGLIDDATAAEIERLGGIGAIAISHPHYYSAMVEWAHRFDCPIHLSAADRKWIMRPDPAVQLFDGDELDLGHGLTLHRIGGHYPGMTVLHQAGGSGGAGSLMSGDLPLATPDKRWVAFQWSYPNRIPLPAHEVRRIADRLSALPFQTLYTAFWDDVVDDGSAVVARSAQRCIDATAAVPAEPEPTPH